MPCSSADRADCPSVSAHHILRMLREHTFAQLSTGISNQFAHGKTFRKDCSNSLGSHFLKGFMSAKFTVISDSTSVRSTNSHMPRFY